MSLRSWRQTCAPLVVALVAAATQVGCKQDQGDPCKEDNDCSGGMICCKSSMTAEARGVCRPDGACDPEDIEIDAGDGTADDAGETGADAASDGGDGEISADAAADGGDGEGSTDAAASGGSDTAAEGGM